MKVTATEYYMHLAAFEAEGFDIQTTTADYHSGYDFESFIKVDGKRIVVAECVPGMTDSDFYIFTESMSVLNGMH